MYTVTVEHRNPSHDEEYCREHRADGYILVTFWGNADGTLKIDAHADGRTSTALVQIVSRAMSALGAAAKKGASSFRVPMEVEA